MRNAKIINDLDPVFRTKIEEWLARIEKEGGEVLLTEGRRTAQKQDALYAIGRDVPGVRVTNARGTPVMQSSHGFGVAVDFAPVVNGVIKYDAVLMKHYGRIATEIGLEWGGDWYAFPDAPHIQYLQGHSLAYFQKGGKLLPEEPTMTISPQARLTSLLKRFARTTDYATKRIITEAIRILTNVIARRDRRL